MRSPSGSPRDPRDAGARAGFRAFLDTLIPDGEYPGHGRTRVFPKLLAEVRGRRPALAAIRRGVALLDERARGLGAASFARLDPEGRARVVATLAAAAEGSWERYFYERVRERALTLHYSHPASWAPFQGFHAPQPQGFLDHAKPPARG